jgi:serine/threonine-protein kinase
MNNRGIIVKEMDDKQFLHVPAGEFYFGPDNKIKETNDFWAARHPVTVKEFALFVRETGYKTTAEKAGWAYMWDPKIKWFKKDGATWKDPWHTGPEPCDDEPVVVVSYHDALAYAKWSNTRIPTEIEWEKMARGKDGRKYPWGNDSSLLKKCNVALQRNQAIACCNQQETQSPYGIMGLIGNAWEWTVPSGNYSPVFKGGSWMEPGYDELSCYDRHWDDPPEFCVSDLGFRVISDIPRD